ncbi:unnamed protein product, partial [Phaeothamnion confervicola]
IPVEEDDTDLHGMPSRSTEPAARRRASQPVLRQGSRDYMRKVFERSKPPDGKTAAAASAAAVTDAGEASASKSDGRAMPPRPPSSATAKAAATTSPPGWEGLSAEPAMGSDSKLDNSEVEEETAAAAAAAAAAARALASSARVGNAATNTPPAPGSATAAAAAEVKEPLAIVVETKPTLDDDRPGAGGGPASAAARAAAAPAVAGSRDTAAALEFKPTDSPGGRFVQGSRRKPSPRAASADALVRRYTDGDRPSTYIANLGTALAAAGGGGGFSAWDPESMRSGGGGGPGTEENRTTRASSRVATTQNGLVPVRRASTPGLLTAATAQAVRAAHAAASISSGSGGGSSIGGGSFLLGAASGYPSVSSYADGGGGGGGGSFVETMQGQAMARALMLAERPGAGGRRDFNRRLGAAMDRIFSYKSGESYDDFAVVAILPTDGKPARLDDYSPRLGPVAFPEAKTFRGLQQRVWELAKQGGHLRGVLASAQADDFALHILGTRSFLPLAPDYDIQWLPAFVAEAWASVHRREQHARSGGGGGAGGSRVVAIDPLDGSGALPCPGMLELCLALRTETLDIESRWHRSRAYLLERKIELIWRGRGSVVVLEGGPGVGKSDVLGMFMAHTLPHTALFHVTVASPYQYHKPFGAWSVVLQQYLDDAAHTLSRRSMTAGSENGGISGGNAAYEPAADDASDTTSVDGGGGGPFSIGFRRRAASANGSDSGGGERDRGGGGDRGEPV